MRARLLHLIIGFTLTGALAACGDHVVVSPTGDVGAALQRWEANRTANYSYVFDSTCGSTGLLGTYRVSVQGSRVTDLEILGNDAGGSDARPVDAPTIDAIFDEIRGIKLDDVDALEANYHPKLGYPTWFLVDPDEDVDDDETCYTVSSVRAD